MSRLPLRTRITLLAVGPLLAAMALLVASGGITEIDETVAIGTLESSGEALAEADADLARYVDDLRSRLGDKGDESFDDWGDIPGLRRAFYDEAGSRVGFDPVGAVTLTETIQCRASSTLVACESETVDDSPRLPDWASQLVRERADEADDVPFVVHGFVATDQAGVATLIRLETDIFAASEGDLSAGLGNLAGIVLVGLLVGFGAVTWFLLGRVLSPVEAIRTQVDRIGAGNLDQRVPVPEADDELRHLAETMNRMLDRLERASESQRRFISDASHELRSPITATGATLELAIGDPGAADWPEVATILEEENTRLAKLVDDLLLLARLDEEQQSGRFGRPSSVDLDELCLTEAERSHPVEVSVHVAAPARVVGDAAALTRAIRNLVDNAAGYAATSVRIEVDSAGPDAVVRVVDDGPGVAAEHVDRIFERFFRADESRTRTTGGGAGLGLAIARQVAENHGGTLSVVDPPPDAGAAFELRVPSEPVPVRG